MEKLVLIDGNSLINRAFYAMPLLTTKDGTPTNAVYGFMNMFFKMLSDINPTFIAVAFDLKAPTFRHALFSDYKGTRKPMPDELRPQIPLLKELLQLMGIKTFEKEGIEADDIIGTIAKHTDIKTIIFTGDKDSFQLVDEQTEVHFTKRGISDVDVLSLDNFKEKTDLSPYQIIELKALMGDASDNIPGVSGIGEKTAKSLLNQFSDIETLYQNCDSLKGKLKEKIVQGRDMAFLSKTLATINCDCDVDTDTEKMRFSFPFSKAVKERFVELEFKSLYNKDNLFENGSIDKTSEKIVHSSIDLVSVSSLSQLNALNLDNDVAVCMLDDHFFICDKINEYKIKINKTLLDDGFSLSDILSSLAFLFSSNAHLITFDKKALKHFLKNNFNLSLSAPADDLSIMKYLCDFSGRNETLKDLIVEYSLDQNRPAFSMLQAYELLTKKLKEEEMESLYLDVELPLSDLLYQMEVSGFKVDYNALCALGENYRIKLDQLENQIRTMVDSPSLNVNSPKQLGELLFEKLKIGKGKKTKTGYSTSADVLEALEDSHPVVSLILKYRQLQKIQSTYVEGFKPLIDKNTGLIHTSFNQTVTSTGRLSSKEPNLQNIPVRDDESKEIRKFFVPKSDDRILVSADYSQIELRLLAAFSSCQSLIDAFNDGKDIHKDTASKVFNVPLNDVTPSMRSNAKAVNFGIIYGMSEFGLAKQLKISNAEAREYISTYFKEFPSVKEYMTQNVEFAKKTGYAKTVLGRRRYIKELFSSNFNLRQFGERVAMNMPLQGSSADIIKLAMLGVNKRLREQNLKSELILQVHDELIIDALKSEKDQVEKILIEEMEGAINLAVKLTVELGSGKTWFDAK